MFNENEETLVTLSFNGADFAAARNVTVGPNYSGYYLTANLWGDLYRSKCFQS